MYLQGDDFSEMPEMKERKVLQKTEDIVMTLKGKRTSYGLVEIREEKGGYGLYVNGVLKESSSDLNYILRRFDAY